MKKGKAAGVAAMTQAPLTAINLKAALWDTLNDLKFGAVQPGQGDAIAAQAREILRTVKVQLQVTNQAKRPVPKEVIAFAEDRPGRQRK